MVSFVVDTNVAIAANGRNTHADTRCREACVKKLEYMVKEGVVAVDDDGQIIDEYRNHLRFSGMPGVGDAFFKHVFNYQHQNSRVQRVKLTLSEDDRKGYEELPVNKFDRSDRKFLAVAVVANAVVLNATDSDWQEHEDLMGELEVKVKQLCPQHAVRAR